jgi:hypothetical protein
MQIFVFIRRIPERIQNGNRAKYVQVSNRIKLTTEKVIQICAHTTYPNICSTS